MGSNIDLKGGIEKRILVTIHYYLITCFQQQILNFNILEIVVVICNWVTTIQFKLKFKVGGEVFDELIQLQNFIRLLI